MKVPFFVVDSLAKHMQNEKELIRLRRFMSAARTTRARSEQFRLRRELPCTRVVQILPVATIDFFISFFFFFFLLNSALPRLEVRLFGHNPTNHRVFFSF